MESHGAGSSPGHQRKWHGPQTDFVTLIDNLAPNENKATNTGVHESGL